MKYEKFYSGKLDHPLLKKLDKEHGNKMRLLMEEIEQGSWTKKQKKMQKSNILPNIALYLTFIDNGISAADAKELVREYSYHVANKMHKLLEKLFQFPNFFALFRFIMRKGMTGEEIWRSEILSNDSQNISMNVYKCLWADTCRYFDCPEICEIFCLCDHIVFGNLEKLQFERTQTLGMNGEKCDFCFQSKS